MKTWPKFRVWDKTLNDWCKGTHLLSPDGVLYTYSDRRELWTLKPELFIVQFCSGLVDKNGNEIYDGDIFKYSVTGRFHSVIYLNGGFKCSGGYDLFFYVENDMIVVGNIFEKED